MMGVIELLAIAGGVILLAITFYDLFQTVVLPRPAVRSASSITVRKPRSSMSRMV